MITHSDRNIFISFPDICEKASIAFHFEEKDEVDSLKICNIDESWTVFSNQKLELHFRPNKNGETLYPFVLMVRVNGVNAITGDVDFTPRRTPQNYLSSPPQGAIDGFYLDGEVYPLRVEESLCKNEIKIDLSVYPMKNEAFEYYTKQSRLVGRLAPKILPSTIGGLELNHGGTRECEPLYEDVCCFGDWDWKRGKVTSLVIRRVES